MTFSNTRAPAGHLLCRSLRCKEMYYRSLLPEDRARAVVTDAATDHHVYWCIKTGRAVGPDQDAVALNDCHPERDCYTT